jgi:putative glutamine amidotransferase
MKKSFHSHLFVFLISLFLLNALSFSSQENERYFDTAQLRSDRVQLAILHPSLASIRSLIALKREGLLSIDNLLIIGIYHEKQLTNYRASKKYIQKNNINWIKFHRINGELEQGKLFQKNSLTAELQKIFFYSDGIILFGGADIPPAVYKEKTSLLTYIQTPYRSYLDTTVAFHLLGGWQDEHFEPFLASSPEFPVLGICLGAQSLNVGTGGTLIQDIWSEVYGKKYLEDVLALSPDHWHMNPYDSLYPWQKLRSSHMHAIKLEESGKFIREWDFDKNDTPYVYSAHHQAVGKLGMGIRIIATSLDGRVPEAVEHEKYPHVLGVQFHPEALSLWDDSRKSRLTPDDKEKTCLRSILESKPPSLAFHQKIWSWFSQNIEEYHHKQSHRKPQKSACQEESIPQSRDEW